MAPKPPQPDDDLRFPGTWNLTDAERDRLLQFLGRVEEFREYGYFGFPAEASFTFNEGDLKVEAQLPDEVRLRSAVPVARHFVLENDNPTQFFSILNLLRKSTSEPRFHRKIDAARGAWKGLLDEEVRWGDSNIRTKRDLFGAYANGHYLHSDPAFRAFLEKSGRGIGPMLKQQFAQMIHQMFHQVYAVTPVAANALGRDLLVPGESERAVRAVLDAVGGPRGPIKVYAWAQSPGFRSGANCELDFIVPNRVIDSALGRIHALLVRVHPDREDYAIHWFNEEPDYRLVCLDATGRSIAPLDRAFNHATRAVEERSGLLSEALEELHREAQRECRSAANRGDASRASILEALAAEAQKFVSGVERPTIDRLGDLRHAWIAIRDR